MQTVNGLEEARAALNRGDRDLASPPYAACHAGVNYYRAMLQQLRSEFPDIPFSFTLCCGDDPAIAHDALRLGFKHIRVDCSDGIRAQLGEIANGLGASIAKRDDK